jgi:hypothetical protein
LLIPTSVAHKLRPPKDPVGLGQFEGRTIVPMPIAAMDENDSPQSRKHQVGLAWKAADVQPITKALAMKKPSYQHLRRRILAPDRRHHSAADFRPDNVCHR